MFSACKIINELQIVNLIIDELFQSYYFTIFVQFLLNILVRLYEINSCGVLERIQLKRVAPRIRKTNECTN